jgi:hypothetical protein
MTENIIAWVAKDLDGVHLFLTEPIYTEVSHEWLGWVDKNGRPGKSLDCSMFKDLRNEAKVEITITIDDTKIL